MGNPLAKKVLLIGWDAADWKVINPLMDSGQMPTMERIINNGVMANIATLDPPLSPMLWTSIATGYKADKHGILGFIEPDSKSGSVRPVNITSRKTRALWNILHYLGKKTNVVGWWPSHPAEPINGVMVSNFFQKAGAEYGKPWPMAKDTIYPESLAKELSAMRVHPGELTEAHILPFVPDAVKVDQDKDKRLAVVAKILAEISSVHAVSTWIMENTEWDFMAVYYDGIDHFSHGFMKMHPPMLKGIPEDMFNLYHDVVTAGYKFHDMMLERLIKLAGDDTIVIIVSDHGFHSNHLRPRILPKFPAAPALEHSPYGILCMHGPGIRKDERIYGATLLDITPTILTIFGQPVGRDMDGKILVNAFEKPVEPEFIDSWENIEGDFGTHPPEKKEDTFASAEAMKQLVELGYVEDPGEDKNKVVKSACMEAKYNLSRVYSSSRKFDKAVEILEELFEQEKTDIRYNLDLANYYLQMNNTEKAKNIIENLRTIDNKALPNIDLLEGILLTHEKKHRKALHFLKKAEKSNPRLPGIHLELGKIYLRTTRYKDAESAFLKALEIDEDSAPAYHGLAISQLRSGKYEEAADNALNAIGLIYHFPLAHYHFGEALYMLGMFKEASEAFEVCLTMAPNITKARGWLVKIYDKKLNNKEKTESHNKILKEYMKGKVTIVSGLPRSGTSMVMQMLHAGGMDILTDEKRKADDNNPKGYYEFEAVKSLARDNKWLDQAEGKAVKIIVQLLQFLPGDFEYKIIFIHRDINEVITSQQKMLGKKQDVFPIGIATAFNKELEKVKVWAKKEPNVEMLEINYTDVINNPGQEISKINEFLSMGLDEEKMAGVIDPNLYRNRLK